MTVQGNGFETRVDQDSLAARYGGATCTRSALESASAYLELAVVLEKGMVALQVHIQHTILHGIILGY